MRIAATISLLSAFILSCSALNVGHEEFRCQGTDKGGVCGSVDYIYENKKLLLSKEEQKTTAPGKNDKSSSVDLSPELSEVQKTGRGEIAVPVRKESHIQRILVYPYRTKEDVFVGKHFIFVIVDEGRWLLPDGSPARQQPEEVER